MKKLLPLLLACLLLTGCTREPIFPTETESAAPVPAPVTADIPRYADQATLWFRCGTEPFLAAESRAVSHSRTESHALALLRALVAGPGAASTELTGLFPQGTQVISCTQADRVMFVTLSKHIMNGYADEPVDWRLQSAWAVEVPLRRQLAMQSIAATLTENCDVDSVVIMVEQKNTSTDSLRLRQSYFTLDGDTTLAAPLMRDESLLLTPARTAEVILQAWQEKDYTRLYRFIARTDPATGAARPEEADFLRQIRSLPVLLSFTARGGSISADGQQAVFTVSGAYLDGGESRPFTGMTLRLIREKGVWRIALAELTERGTMQ